MLEAQRRITQHGCYSKDNVALNPLEINNWSYAYDKIFLVTTGAPCVAFSLAGGERGQTDTRGLHDVEHADGYIRGKVPVTLFEQVAEVRQILNKDWKARKTGRSPQDQLVEKLRSNGYTVPNGPDGHAGIIRL